MSRVDAHQHFWKLARGDYGWLTQDLPKLYRDFLPEHLAPLLKRSAIDRAVVVQAAPTVAETRFLLQLAAANPFIAGVVGWADLESPTAADDITELARDESLVGVRPMVQDLPDDEWLLRPALASAIDAIQRANLRFDALVRPRHLPVLFQFLQRHPDLPVVIDHGGKPAIASGEIDAFGPKRLMWGSDWPVLHEAYEAGGPDASPYASWYDIAATLTSGLSSDERESIFGRTASVFYGVA